MDGETDGGAALAAGTVTVVLGDSVAQGRGGPVPCGGWIGWCRRPACLLAVPTEAVRNVSARGVTSRDVARDHLPTVASLRPCLVVLGCGLNDALAGFDLSEAEQGLALVFHSARTANAVTTAVPSPTRPCCAQRRYRGCARPRPSIASLCSTSRLNSKPARTRRSDSYRAAAVASATLIFEEFRYTDDLVSRAPNGSGPPTQALIFEARVLGKSVQGLDLLSYGGTGLVTGLTVMVRPLPAAMILARAVGRRMEDAANGEREDARGSGDSDGPGGSGGSGDADDSGGAEGSGGPSGTTRS